MTEPQLELQYDSEFGRGELIAKDANDAQNKIVIAHLDSGGPHVPNPRCGCGLGGGTPAEANPCPF